MDLKEHIKEIQADLRVGRFANEAAVSQGIVLRILQVLGWPVFDAQVVCPQYSVEGRRVDYALCHPKSKPLVFIEVKQVGQGEGADRQLFEYAFHSGVPMAILTTGQEWHFYLPGEQGGYEERRVYKLDILERDVEESALRFSRYLAYEKVCSKEAINFAREDYKNVARQRDMKRDIPIAWQRLIEEQDELLVELIADRVEDMCGYKPEPDLVADFLAGQSLPSALETVLVSSKQVGRKPPASEQPIGNIGFVFNGREQKARNARDVFIKVMEELSSRDPNFLERFATLPKHGNKRRYVARTKEELYPGRPDLCAGNSYKLPSGWWIGTHYSKKSFKGIIEMACEVAGLRFGTDLKINLGD